MSMVLSLLQFGCMILGKLIVLQIYVIMSLTLEEEVRGTMSLLNNATNLIKLCLTPNPQLNIDYTD